MGGPVPQNVPSSMAMELMEVEEGPGGVSLSVAVSVLRYRTWDSGDNGSACSNEHDDKVPAPSHSRRQPGAAASGGRPKKARGAKMDWPQKDHEPDQSGKREALILGGEEPT